MKDFVSDGWPAQVLSVSEHFGTSSVPFSGHEEVYQLGMQRAGAAAGLDWRILVPFSSRVAADAAERCLESGSLETLIASLDARLRVGTLGGRVIVLYEGSVTLAVAMGGLARAHPHERFIVNLYRRERTLDAPSLPGSPVRLSVELDDLVGEVPERARQAMRATRLPENLVLTAETPRRALLARSLGLPVRSVWHLHSELADFRAHAGESTAGSYPRMSERGARVLIALSRRQFEQGTLRQVLEVVRAVRRLGDADHPIEWILPADAQVLGSERRMMRRLANAGVRVVRTVTPLPQSDYAAHFLESDAAWFPKVWPYRVTSSGKALDALVLGCPIIAPAGTAASDAMQRWVPGSPDYGTTEEAVAVFLRLPTLLPTLATDLAGRLTEVHQQYSAATTVSWLIALLAESANAKDGSAMLARPLPDAPSSSEDGRSLAASKLPRQRTGLSTMIASIWADALAAFRRHR